MQLLGQTLFHPCYLNACHFDKAATLPIILFEIYIFVATGLVLYLLRDTKKLLIKYAITFIGVLIFELFTAPMWNNYHLGQWAYLYRDVSWILTIGWSTMILGVVLAIDQVFHKLHASKRFFLYLIFLTVLVTLFESVVVHLGIRSYSPEVMEVVGKSIIPGLLIPLQTFYYVPVFMALVISFYKYWEFYVMGKPVVPVKKRKILRSFLLSFIAVFLFELMIETMANNVGFPKWSYVYHHITFLVTGIWVILIWISTLIVEKYFLHLNLLLRFVGTVAFASVLYFPIESSFILHHMRVYGESAVANFSGFYIVGIHVPIEVAFAIPFYLSLIIAFIRYWEIVKDNKL